MPVTDNSPPIPVLPEVTPTDRDKEIQKMLEKLWTEKTRAQEQLQKSSTLFNSMSSIQLISRRQQVQDPAFPDDSTKRIDVTKFHKPNDIDNKEMSDQRRTEIFDRCKIDYDEMFPE